MITEETLVQCQHCGQQYYPVSPSEIHTGSDSDYSAKSVCTHCQKQNIHNIYFGVPQPEYDDEKEYYALREQEDYDNYLENDGNQYYTLPIQPPPAKPQTFRLTDVGNAKRLVSLFGQDIRYSGGGWYYWNGRRWQKGADGRLMRLAKKTADSIFEEAKLAPEGDKKKLLKFGEKTESKPRLSGMISLVPSEEGISIPQESFDTNHWLLNTQNGTLNLKTGQLNQFNRDNLNTKIIPVSCSPGAECPTWKSFLTRVMAGNQNLINFLQRVVGYSLTGSTKEQCFFFLWGTGANGKSTFLEIIRELMGDYAQQTDFSTFLKKQDAVRNDVARLQGARYVSGVEAGAGQQLQETLIKRLTGQDKITARYLYQEFFEYDPTFKIFLGANHRPVIKGTDHAIWRRIHLIPFTVTIPPEEQDGNLREKLRQELPGILNWALQGCLNWQKNGLQPPEEVTMATAEYRADMDVLVDFLGDYCEVKQGVSVKKIDLYNAYVNWCQQNSEEPIKINPFGTKMIEKGFNPKDKSGNVRIWKGIQLKQ